MRRRQILTFALAFMLCACGENAADKVSGVQPVYDDNTAFVLASQEIPAGKLDYYLFDFDPELHIDPGEAIKNNVEEIQSGLQDNPPGFGLYGSDRTRRAT